MKRPASFFRVVVGIVIAIILIASVAFPSLQPPRARMTAKVVDEAGNPVPGASVQIFFDRVVPGKALESAPASGSTDANGQFSDSGPTGEQRIAGRVQKEGYYQSLFRSPLLRIESRHWEPWNPTVPVTLHKIVHPIPMYAKKVATELPVAESAAGFDLLAGDWVAPFGRGKTADVMFTLKRRFTSDRDYESQLTVGFSEPADGIQPWYNKDANYSSGLKLPRLAPANEYVQPLVLSNQRLPGKFIRWDVNEQRSYFFRVRTVLDEEGKVGSALYGKIDGSIVFSPMRSKTCSLMFTYYLNPTPNDLNVEFDPKRNLLTGLKEDQRVLAP